MSRHSVHLYRKSMVWSHLLVIWKRSTLNFYAANTFSKELLIKTRRLSHGNDKHVLTLLLPFPLPHPGMPAAYDLSTVIGSGQPASHNNLIPLGMNLTSQWRLNMRRRLRGRELEGGVAGTHRRLQKNKIKSLINSQTIKQQKMNVKAEVLDFNVFNENRHLHSGEVKLIAVGFFFFQERQYLQVHYSQTLGLAFGWNFRICLWIQLDCL